MRTNPANNQTPSKRQQVLVLGAGLAGLSSAWFLSQAGFEVTVIEAESEVATGASYANAGMLTPSMSDPWNVPGVYRHVLSWLGRDNAPMLLRAAALPSMLGWGMGFLRNSSSSRYQRNMLSNYKLALYSLGVLEQLNRKKQLNFGLGKTGTVKIFRQQEQMDIACRRIQPLLENGLNAESLSATAVVELEPALKSVSDNITGGLYFADDSNGDAYKYCTQLAVLCQLNGVGFQYSTKVDELVVEAGVCTGIIAAGKRWIADEVVLALGSWSHKLAKKAGLKLPIQPVKGYSITLDSKAWQDAPKIPVIDESLHAAITPMAGQIRVAGTAEFAAFNLDLPAARIANLKKLLEKVYPEFASIGLSQELQPWAGFRPMSVDGVPLLGKTAIKGLYLNTGHGHLGWTMAAGSGQLLADIISGNPTQLEAEQYQVSRFS